MKLTRFCCKFKRQSLLNCYFSCNNLGNSLLHRLTNVTNYKLRVELERFNGICVYAEYLNFTIGPPSSKYTLMISGYSGTAGNVKRC